MMHGKNKERFIAIDIGRRRIKRILQILNEHWNIIRQNLIWIHMPPKISQDCLFSEGSDFCFYTEPIPGEIPGLWNDSRVFEQTYTRFLDLQKAEAQAREAKIEAALERVRSRTWRCKKVKSSKK